MSLDLRLLWQGLSQSPTIAAILKRRFADKWEQRDRGFKNGAAHWQRPDAVLAKDWDLSMFAQRVAINNAWQITPDWDYLVYPEDFAPERLPPTPLKPSSAVDRSASNLCRSKTALGALCMRVAPWRSRRAIGLWVL